MTLLHPYGRAPLKTLPQNTATHWISGTLMVCAVIRRKNYNKMQTGVTNTEWEDTSSARLDDATKVLKAARSPRRDDVKQCGGIEQRQSINGLKGDMARVGDRTSPLTASFHGQPANKPPPSNTQISGTTLQGYRVTRHATPTAGWRR